MESNIRNPNEDVIFEQNKDVTSSMHNEGIDDDFHSWKEKTEQDGFDEIEVRATGQTQLPSLKDENRMFDENPLETEEDLDPPPSDSINVRETSSKIAMDKYQNK